MLSAGMFTGCMLDNDEPAGIEAMRTAKAEYYSAEAAYKNAQALYEIAKTAWETTANELANAATALDNAAKEYANAVTAAYSEERIAYYEAEVAKHKATVVEYEKDLVNNQKDLAQAQFDYAEKIYDLEVAYAQLDDEARSAISTISSSLTSAMTTYNNANTAFNNYSAKLIEYLTEEEVSIDTFKADLQVELDRATLAVANNASLISSYESIIAGYSDITATAETQKTAIVAAVAAYNTDYASLQTLVNEKQDKVDALEATQYDWKNTWTVAQSKTTANDVANDYLINNYIKSTYGSTVSAANMNKYGITVKTVDGTSVYSFSAGNKFTFAVDAYDVKTNASTGAVTVDYGFGDYPISNFYVNSSTLATLNGNLTTAKNNVANYVGAYYTAPSAMTTVEQTNYETGMATAITAATTATTAAKKTYDDAVTAYEAAVKAYTDAKTKTQALVDDVNVKGQALYGGTYNATYTKADFSDLVLPTTFIATVDGEYAKVMYGINTTQYDGAWMTYYSAYSAEQNLLYAQAAYNLYKDVSALSTEVEAEYLALTLQADKDQTTYDDAKDAIDAEYAPQTSVLMAKVGGSSLPAADATVYPIEIRYTETSKYTNTSGTTTTTIEYLKMGLYQNGTATSTFSNESGKVLDALVTAYNAIVSETEKSYFENLLLTAKDETDGLLDAQDTAEQALAEATSLGYELDNTEYLTGTSISTKILSVVTAHYEGLKEIEQAKMDAAQVDIDYYTKQIDALLALVVAE